jgi:hypothetical protein
VIHDVSTMRRSFLLKASQYKGNSRYVRRNGIGASCNITKYSTSAQISSPIRYVQHGSNFHLHQMKFHGGQTMSQLTTRRFLAHYDRPSSNDDHDDDVPMISESINLYSRPIRNNFSRILLDQGPRHQFCLSLLYSPALLLHFRDL